MLKGLYKKIFPHRTFGTLYGVVLVTTLILVLFGSGVEIVFAEADPLSQFLGSAVDLFFKPIATFIFVVAITVGGMFIGIGGLALDLTLQWFVVGMGGWFSGDFGLGVVELWKLVRDIFNILFIYSFVYLGIRTILNADSASTQRALGYLLVAAVLINFSLFVTQAIVDFSNIAATQIYNQIIYGAGGADGVTRGGLIGSGSSGFEHARFEPWSIAGAFLNIAAVTTFFGGANSMISAEFSSIKILTYSIFLMFFFIIAGFTFLIAAIRLIYRFVALLMYMVFSPAMFLGWILPNFASQSSKWWDGFLKNAFYAPAFLFLIYMSLLLMQRMRTILIPENPDYTALFKGGAMTMGEFGIIIFFAMMIGLVYASVKVGDLMSVAGMNASKKLTGTLYSNTLGRAVKKWGVGTFDALDHAAEGEGNGLKKGAARVTRFLAGGELGRSRLDKLSKFTAGGVSYEDIEKANKERSKRAAAGNAAAGLQRAIVAGTKAPEGAAGNEARIKMESEIAGASVSDLVKLAQSDADFELLKEIAGKLPEKKFESMLDSDDLTPQQKAALDKARKSHTEEIIKSTAEGNLQKGISGASADALNALDYKALTDNAFYLQSDQLDKLENKWGSGEKIRALKDARTKQFEAAFAEGEAGVARILESRKGEKEMAKLPTDLFTKHLKAFVAYTSSDSAKVKMSGGLLKNIASDSKLSGDQKKALGMAVWNAFASKDGGVPDDVTNFFRSGMGAEFGVNPEKLNSEKNKSKGPTFDQSV